MLSPIQCADPVLVVRNDLLDLLSTFKYDIYLDGIRCENHLVFAAISRFRMFFSPKRTKVTVDTMCGYFLENRETKDRVAIYGVYPCGKCALCCADKRESWSFRAECETACWAIMPVFLTLTYDEINVPYSPSGVRTLCKEHVQQFFQKLRDTLRYRYKYTKPIRYICVGEYGSPQYTARPHYHITMWNFPTASDFGLTFPAEMARLKRDEIYIKFVMKFLTEVRSYHSRSQRPEGIWPKCSIIDFDYCGVKCQRDAAGRPIWCTRRYDMAGAAAGCAKYVAKYVTKGTHVPVGAAPAFLLTSRKNGGIGRPYIDKHPEQFERFTDLKTITVMNPFSKQTTTSVLPLSFRQYLFPSLSRMFKRGFRDSLKRLHEFANLLVKASSYVTPEDDATFIITDKYTAFPLLRQYDYVTGYYDSGQYPAILRLSYPTESELLFLDKHGRIALLCSVFRSANGLQDFSPYHYDNTYELHISDIMERMKYSSDRAWITSFRRDLYFTCRYIEKLLTSFYTYDCDKMIALYNRVQSYKQFIINYKNSTRWFDVEKLNHVQEYYDNLNNLKRLF